MIPLLLRGRERPVCLPVAGLWHVRLPLGVSSGERRHICVWYQQKRSFPSDISFRVRLASRLPCQMCGRLHIVVQQAFVDVMQGWQQQNAPQFAAAPRAFHGGSGPWLFLILETGGWKSHSWKDECHMHHLARVELDLLFILLLDQLEKSRGSEVKAMGNRTRSSVSQCPRESEWLSEGERWTQVCDFLFGRPCPSRPLSLSQSFSVCLPQFTFTPLPSSSMALACSPTTPSPFRDLAVRAQPRPLLSGLCVCFVLFRPPPPPPPHPLSPSPPPPRPLFLGVVNLTEP